MPSLPRPDLVALLVAACLAPQGIAKAGGGPENVFLVFNSASDDSKNLALHYARLRRIPAINRFGVPWHGSVESVSAAEFRSDLLGPVLQEIDARKLNGQIDYVVYSCDLPWRVDLRGDLKDTKTSIGNSPYASITGATYLYQFLMASSPAILGLRTNWYVPNSGYNLLHCKNISSTPSRGFDAREYWTPEGPIPRSTKKPDQAANNQPEKPQLRYLLSTMLAVTSGRGNTVSEARNYLNAAARADSIAPEGTFYFMRNSTVRSQPRDQCFDAVVKELQAIGARAKVVQGVLPKGVNDALGIVTGTPSYNLSRANVKLLPGAIGDNLTSYGGILTTGAGQTPLTAMLRHGAAGASGTVHEPTALQAKFPLPTLMLHYRRGCSLAESFYQSVSGPYQLLIVGDPLCQPWAREPRVAMPGFHTGQVVTGPLVLKPKVTNPEGPPSRVWTLFIDGRLVARVPVGAALRFDAQKLNPGNHEIRVVAIGGDAIQSQGRWISNFTVRKTTQEPANPEALPEVPVVAEPPVVEK